MYSETPPLQPIRPKGQFHILDEGQIQTLANGTLEILAETGVHCPSEKCLNIYAEHGAEVDFEHQIVRIPPELALASIKTAPRYYTMGTRSPAHDLNLDGSSMYCATD